MESSIKVHQLASLEADLALAEGYCNLCKGAMDISPKLNAMKYCSKVIEDARDYQLNAPITDVLIKSYKLIKPLFVPLFKGLEKYRTKEGTKKLLKGFIKEYGESEQYGSLVMQTVGIIKEYGDIDDLKEFLVKNGLEELVQSVSEMGNKKELVGNIRDISKKLRTEDTKNENNIISNMKLFIGKCSTVRKEYDAGICDKYCTPNITKSKKELEKLIDKVEYRDLTSGVSWFLDVIASIGDNMSDKEFEEFKLKAPVFLKEFLEELDI